MMKKNIIALLLILVLLLSFAACGEYVPAENGGDRPGSTVSSDSIGGTTTTGGETPNGTTENPSGGEDEPSGPFTATVMLDGKPYTEAAGMSVRWSDGKSSYTQPVGADGTASVDGLDGDYAVTLLNLPEGYLYNPNIYIASNESRNVKIELTKITKTLGNGTELYKCKSIRKTGAYRADIERDGQVVYYEFTPPQAGVYYIESMVDVSANMYNPIVKVYTGTTAAKFEQNEIDEGGVSNTYTKNFLHKIVVYEEYIHNTWTFAIRVEGKDAVYPTYVDFTVTYADSADGGESANAQIMIPEKIPSELNYFDKLIYTTVDTSYFTPDQLNNATYKWFVEYEEYLNADKEKFGSEWIIASERVDGKNVFNEDGYKLNPDDGYYHVYDMEKYAAYGGWGPILYADISIQCKFLNSPLNTIEYGGNKTLTVSEGTENYKLFIEGSYPLTLRHSRESGPYFCNDNNTCPCYVVYIEAHDKLLAAIDEYKEAVKNGRPDVPTYVNKIMTLRQNLNSTNGGSCDSSCTSCYERCRHLPEENKYQLGYADIAVDGRAPVTEELKVFMQKLSESQRYFSDGNGWIEEYGYTAFEDSQWLFPCGYYQ